MENLERSYWMKHRSILAVAGLCGFLFVVYTMRSPHRYQMYMLVLFPVFSLLFSPFTLETAAGRLWWRSCLLAVGGGVSAVLFGFHNPLGWLCACLAGYAYAVGVCLRWNSPLDHQQNRSLPPSVEPNAPAHETENILR